jgi:citrate lyase beta subunit
MHGDPRLWRQQATLVAPADSALAEKALTRGTDRCPELLRAAAISPDELADAIDVDAHLVRNALDYPVPATTVVLDAEDGVAGDGDARVAAAISAGILFREAPRNRQQLRFLRLLNPRNSIAHEMLNAFLEALGDGDCDGIVLPKVEHAEEVDECAGWLMAAESRSSRAPMSISVMLETARGVLSADSILHAAQNRICSVAIGAIDLAADVGWLGALPGRQELNYLRYQASLHAATLDIPALDGMTIEFPVAAADATAAERHEFVLARLALVASETRTAVMAGLRGKWVGHPLQLLAVLLTFAQVFSPSRVSNVDGSAAPSRVGRGVWLSGSDMQDAATLAREARLLRDAVRLGYAESVGAPATPSAKWFRDKQ